ncbi:hypothetical protein CDO73_23390 [Saccharibacillus sp. O23]|uniref:ribosomal maturation YjgA family protein n=1 Tax=Saccharibacillus sp. O23 TaxID=2009338 RepID=UPI000B4E6E07|nr:DUF2809 domain-containing protein [Saccharibacillus sp. O23]OWR27194.1 hypothetical protein CDO73_23390 [Saccharibacillus sp. O23]
MRSKRPKRKAFLARRRFAYAAAAVATLLSGLASRVYGNEIPRFLAIHAGDALWAAMIYWLIRLILPGRSTAICAGYALLLSFGVEFSQLYRAEWIDGLRKTTLGALVLGRGFLLADLVRYSAGVVCVFALDTFASNRRKIFRNTETFDRNR